MKKLNNDSLELFYRLDEKKYFVEKNQQLKDLMKKLKISCKEQDIQDFINKLACWYYVKLPNQIFETKQNLENDMLQGLNGTMNLETLFQNFNTIELELINFSRFKGLKREVRELFFQYLLKMAGYEMIYSKKSLPKYGVARAEFMFYEFNRYFDWKLNTNMYDYIIMRDYSLTNPTNVQLLKHLRDKQKKSKKEKNSKKKKKLRGLFHS